MKAKRKNICIAVFTALFALCAALFGYSINLINRVEALERGQAFAPSASGFTKEFDVAADAQYVGFEYCITSGEKISLMIGNWEDYYGYYDFNANGPVDSYQGMSWEKLSDGYINVVCELSVLDRTESSWNRDNAPTTEEIEFIFFHGTYTDASGYIDNVRAWRDPYISMLQEQTIRFAQPAGLRFMAEIQTAGYSPDYTYGMIIVPKEYITDNLLTGDYVADFERIYAHSGYVNIQCTPYRTEENGNYFINGVIANIADENLARDFIGIGYIDNGVFREYAVIDPDLHAGSAVKAAAAALENPYEYTPAHIAFLEDLIERGAQEPQPAESDDLLIDSLYRKDMSDQWSKFEELPLGEGVTMSLTKDSTVKNGDDFSLKFAVDGSNGDYPKPKFELPSAFDMSEDAYFKIDVKFSPAAYPWIAFVLFDADGRQLTNEFGGDMNLNSANVVYDRQSGWNTYTVNVHDVLASNIVAKDLHNVKYFTPVFNFATNQGQQRIIWLDNLKTNARSVHVPVVNDHTEHITAYAPTNTLQVRGDEPYLPILRETTLTFGGARGERETGQVILYQDSAINKSYTVSFSDFTNGGYQISASAIETYIQLYQNVKTNWVATESQPEGWHPNGPSNLPLGWFPDALLPYDVARFYGKNILKMENGCKNQGLFFVLEIPKDCPAGVYEGYLTVKIAGEGNIVLPVNIEVFDFELPSQTASKITAGIDLPQTQALYGGDNTSVYYTQAWEFLAQRGVSGGHVSGTSWGPDEFEHHLVELKKAAADDRIGVYYLFMNYSWVAKVTARYDGNKTAVAEDIPVLDLEDGELIGNGSSKRTVGLKTQLMRLVEESTNEIDILKKVSVYFPQADEPNGERGFVQNIVCENALNRAKDYVLQNADFTGKELVKESLQNLKYHVTASPTNVMKTGIESITVSGVSEEIIKRCGLDNLVYKKVTGFCPMFTAFLPSAPEYNDCIDMIADENYSIWWYGCIQPTAPYASYIINAPMLAARVNRWQQFALNIEGELYYMANRTYRFENGENSAPLTEEQILNGEATYEKAYGDGLLIYPVSRMYANYNAVVEDDIYYLSSLRLENMAEGNDDYNYLAYASSLIEKLADGSAYRARLNDIVNDLYTNPTDNTTDPAVFKIARYALADLIEELAVIA